VASPKYISKPREDGSSSLALLRVAFAPAYPILSAAVYPLPPPPPSPTQPALSSPAPSRPTSTPPHPLSSPSTTFSLDEQLLDYSATPSPRSSSATREICQEDVDIGAPAKKLSYIDVLLSPFQVLEAPNLPKPTPEDDESAAAPSQPCRHKLLSTLLNPAKQASPSRAEVRNTATLPMKVSRHGEMLVKKGSSGGSIHGWQVVRHKVWRKKLPLHGQQRQPRRPVHERLQWPAADGQRTGPSSDAQGSQQLASLFKKRVAGRCFQCLATGHRVAVCRDPAKMHPLPRFRPPCSPLPQPPSSFRPHEAAAVVVLSCGSEFAISHHVAATPPLAWSCQARPPILARRADRRLRRLLDRHGSPGERLPCPRNHRRRALR
jgi:hypothetical protein